jgi:glycosyltransferase involved in cell wall biosynthesis
MEGMAMDLPVVATSISGIPELVQHGRTGLLVPEKDHQALADALLLLYRSPELRKRLGEAGRNKVLQDFNLHRNAEKLFKLFDPEEPGVNMDSLLTDLPEWENQGATKW